MKAALIAAALLVVAFFAWGAILSGQPEAKEKTIERDAIAACRAGQDDELQELSTRRAFRKVCDQMESEFVAKWGTSP